ncbi:ABC transporter substrate-binding protein [Martelella sp. HB161492]|uniref:heme/hemin ABC transporter substrate-binding protein n=1 Tax=Martelella sp. HB161492 TaxID=2720726 RepID=UPI001592519F|nr:ABC transporter substrate-binding protein [Martelella sp. HB161492]
MHIHSLLSASRRIALLATLGLAIARPASADPLADPSRLVSIGGSVTEIIYALGAGDLLVGRDTTSMYPPQAMALPDIGYMRQLAPEGVLSVDPSAIIAIEGSGPPETLDVLKNADVTFAEIPETYDRAGIVGEITAIGDLLGKQTEATALVEAVTAKLDPILARNEARPAASRKKAIFILSLSGGKVMASGTGTAADGILTLAGLDNAVGSYPGYKALTDEAIIAAAPDVIIMMSGVAGNHAVSDADALAQPALALTPAGRNHAIFRVDPIATMSFGPRLADGVEALSTAIYGGA